MSGQLFTSESVTEGHPDKICDQISDAILDAIIAEDPYARVACETAVTTGMVFVMGEITTDCYIDIPKVVRETVLEIGYNRAKYGFDGETCAVITSIDEQSGDIAMGVDNALETKTGAPEDSLEAIGAGDQGTMFGYACDETPELMPMPIMLAHKLTRRLSQVRKDGLLSYLRPDGKSQVTVEYDEDRPVRVDTVILSAQHGPEVSHDEIERDLIDLVIKKVIPAEMLDNRTRFLVNPTGRFVTGGPQGDSGLTGRKIIVDTYGGYAGMAAARFQGKTLQKWIVRLHMRRVALQRTLLPPVSLGGEIQLAYAIGVARPVSVYIDTFGTGKLPDGKLALLVQRYFDLRPAAIIQSFDLRRPIYKQTAAYGHFGRIDIDLPWEKTDKAAVLRNAALEI